MDLVILTVCIYNVLCERDVHSMQNNVVQSSQLLVSALQKVIYG